MPSSMPPPFRKDYQVGKLRCYFSIQRGCYLKKNLNAPRPSEHVVVDSHIQRSVLGTEETTVTQQVSHRPIKCQSRLWSQRGTKVNGSHRGGNPLLKPNGSSNLLTPYREQPRSTRIVVTYPRPAFSATKRNYAPTSFGQQIQNSQGHTSYKNKGN